MSGEGKLVADMFELARQFSRYDYRRIAVLLREASWSVSDGHVELLWRQEGLKVPQKQSKKGRPWLMMAHEFGCVLSIATMSRSYDFFHCRTDDGKVFQTLNIINEFTRKCLAIKVNRKLNSTNVIDALNDLFILRGSPALIRSDNAPEFIAQAVRDWSVAVGTKTAYTEPESPCENIYCESFDGRFRDKLLNG